MHIDTRFCSWDNLIFPRRNEIKSNSNRSPKSYCLHQASLGIEFPTCEGSEAAGAFLMSVPSTPSSDTQALTPRKRLRIPESSATLIINCRLFKFDTWD